MQTRQFASQHYARAQNAFTTFFLQKIYQIEYNKKINLFTIDSQGVSDHIFMCLSSHLQKPHCGHIKNKFTRVVSTVPWQNAKFHKTGEIMC